MAYVSPLDWLPVWGVMGFTLAVAAVAIEAGFRIGRYRRRVSSREDRPPVGEVVAAVLALLAFMLAFTFGFAATRFEVRRDLMVDEANAVGTTYLRAGMMPEPQRGEIRTLLRQYVESRIAGTDPARLAQEIRRSEELQARLWDQATEIGRAQPNSVIAGLFVSALNETIDLHTKRLTQGVRTRIPGTLWLSLFVVTALGMGVLGYHTGLSGGTRSLASGALIVAFAVVLTLVADLDRPHEGYLRVGQQPMMDLLRTMGDAPPPR